MSKYDHLIYAFEKQENFWGDFMPPYQAYFRGHDCMPDSSFYSSYRCYMKEAFVDRWPNFHSEEEYLCFTGYDMVDPWSSFDAELEFWIGKDRSHMEKHIITEPTIIRIPPYYWHCPLEYRRVTKPVYLQVLGIRGKFGAHFQKIDENGKKYIEYSGSSGHMRCRIDNTKQCTFCGKCQKVNEADPKTAAETMARVAAGA
jgi:hypothetical protein